MEEKSGDTIQDYVGSGGDMPTVEEETDPKDRMDSFPHERVSSRKGMTRAATTPQNNDRNTGLPEKLEVINEDEERKRGNKCRTSRKHTAAGSSFTGAETQSKGSGTSAGNDPGSVEIRDYKGWSR